MVVYTHTYTAVTDESGSCELDFTGGADMNYAKPTKTLAALVKVVYAGVDITSSCSVANVPAVGMSVVFGVPSTRLGLVLVDYHSGTEAITGEPVDIIRFNNGGTANNYITLANFPVKVSSLVIKDGDGNDVSSYYTGIDTIKKTIRVGNLAKGKYLVTYDYDAGEAGKVYQDYSKIATDITDITAYIAETDGKYQADLLSANSDYSVAVKNFTNWLKSKIFIELPSVTLEVANIKEVKDEYATYASTASHWDNTNYSTFANKILAVKTSIDSNNGDNLDLSHDKYQPKFYTYLAELAEIENEEITITFSSTPSDNKRYNYDGTSGSANLSAPNLAKFIDSQTLSANSYYEAIDYCLKLKLTTPAYISKFKIYTVPSDNAETVIDSINVSLLSEDLTPDQLGDGGTLDKQKSNRSYKRFIDIKTNKQYYLGVVNESFKDGDGSPISGDSAGNKFDHRILMPRNYIVIYKKANAINNYVSEIKILEAKGVGGLSKIVDRVFSNSERSNVSGRVNSFNGEYNDSGTPSRIYAWRGDSGLGVDTSGLVGSGAGYYNANDINSTAWAFVKTDLDAHINHADFTFNTDAMTNVLAWKTTLATEGITNDPKTTDQNYLTWKEKYTSASSKYLGVLNSKNTKQVELINKTITENTYLPLPSIT